MLFLHLHICHSWRTVQCLLQSQDKMALASLPGWVCLVPVSGLWDSWKSCQPCWTHVTKRTQSQGDRLWPAHGDDTGRICGWHCSPSPRLPSLYIPYSQQRVSNISRQAAPGCSWEGSTYHIELCYFWYLMILKMFSASVTVIHFLMLNIVYLCPLPFFLTLLILGLFNLSVF